MRNLERSLSMLAPTALMLGGELNCPQCLLYQGQTGEEMLVDTNIMSEMLVQ